MTFGRKGQVSNTFDNGQDSDAEDMRRQNLVASEHFGQEEVKDNVSVRRPTEQRRQRFYSRFFWQFVDIVNGIPNE